MSYRNPLIIDDKSGIAGAQDITNVGNTFAGIINAKNEKARLAKEKKDKEDDLISKQVINMANKKAEGDAQFVAGLTDLGGTIQSSLGSYYENLTQNNFELRELQLAGDASPEVSKQIGQNLQKMLEARTLGEQMIATTNELPELIDNYEAINKTIFLQHMEDPNTGEVNGNLSKAIIFGFGGKKDYTASMVNADGELRAQVITPEGVTYSIPAKKFKDITENLTLEKVNNAAESQIQFTNNELKDKKGNINQSLINGSEEFNEIRNGIQYIGTRNLLDFNSIKAAKDNAVMDTKALLTSVEGNTQLRNLYLADLKIDSADYEDANEEDKAKMVTDKANELFDRTSGITMRNGNYYNDNVSKSFKAETPKVIKIAEPSKSFKAFEARIKASDPNKIAPQDFGLVSGADIKVGSTTKTLLDVSFMEDTSEIKLKYKDAVENKDGSVKTAEDSEVFDLSNPAQLDALLIRLPRLEGDEELAAKELIMAKMAMIEKNKNDSSNSSDQPAKIKPEADQTYNTQT